MFFFNLKSKPPIIYICILESVKTCSLNDTTKKRKDKAKTGGKYLQNKYLIRPVCIDYIKNLGNISE